MFQILPMCLFVFKQKTAYEMRISDWSSDVCSSELNVDTYIDGIGKLFAKYEIEGAQPAIDALAKQLTDYEPWARTTVLLEARTDATLPPALYALARKSVESGTRLAVSVKTGGSRNIKIKKRISTNSHTDNHN